MSFEWRCLNNVFNISPTNRVMCVVCVRTRARARACVCVCVWERERELCFRLSRVCLSVCLSGVTPPPPHHHHHHLPTHTHPHSISLSLSPGSCKYILRRHGWAWTTRQQFSHQSCSKETLFATVAWTAGTHTDQTERLTAEWISTARVSGELLQQMQLQQGLTWY